MMEFLHVKWRLIALLTIVAIAAPVHAQGPAVDNWRLVPQHGLLHDGCTFV